MTTYRIHSTAGADFGTYVAATPAAALLALHRDAGYDESAVVLKDGELSFGAGYREICGDVSDWDIAEVGADND